MTKRCIICEKEALYCVKGSSEYYCQECAKEAFGDIACLVKVEKEAQKLKEIVDKKINGKEEEEEDY